MSTILLESAGVRLEAGEGDVRLARLVSLAGEKFLYDILIGAMDHCKLANGQSTGLLSRSNTPSSKDSCGTSGPPDDSKSQGGEFDVLVGHLVFLFAPDRPCASLKN